MNEANGLTKGEYKKENKKFKSFSTFVLVIFQSILMLFLLLARRLTFYSARI